MTEVVRSRPMRVRAVVERKTRRYVSGYGNSAVFEDVSAGWFVEVLDCPTIIEAGKTRPELEAGDMIWIEVHKMEVVR